MRLPAALRRDPKAIPLTDARSLRRQAQRTWAVRVALGAALVACLLVAISVSRDASGSRRTFFSTAKSSVVVIDISGSIGPRSRELIGRTLRRLLDARNSFGLVFFSDTAYEAVPPGTRWTELEPLLQYFQPVQAPAADGRRRRVQDTPWAAFRGGTRISTGLDLARSILRRTGTHDAGVLLISDLNNSIFDGAGAHPDAHAVRGREDPAARSSGCPRGRATRRSSRGCSASGRWSRRRSSPGRIRHGPARW